jgi:hypothetical protein
MSRDSALVSLKLKGFIRADMLGDAAAGLMSDALISETKMGIRLTPLGRDAAAAVWAAERAFADAASLEDIYSRFSEINSSFKALVTDWQIRGGEPNDHSDADYDGGVIARLNSVHTQLTPILADTADQVPRTIHYADAFEGALAKISAGETRWMAAPVIDSYHTLWFELHEELIQLTGRTRAAEAAAGHGA